MNQLKYDKLMNTKARVAVMIQLLKPRYIKFSLRVNGGIPYENIYRSRPGTTHCIDIHPNYLKDVSIGSHVAFEISEPSLKGVIN